MTAVVVALAGLVAAVPGAHAADTDVVLVPDATLKAGINRALGGGRALDADITVADAARVTTIAASAITGPVSDLTGLEALTNMTAFSMGLTIQGNTFTDLTPVSGLSKLTTLVLPNSLVTDVSPLAGLTQLRSLNLVNNRIVTVPGLSGLTALTGLSLQNNLVRDLTGIPAAPNLTSIQLSGNKITDLGPLTGKFTKSVLTILNLSSNRIVDPAPIVDYGLGGGKLGSSLTGTQGLFLGSNRIRDLSSLAGWPTKPTGSRVSGQTVYVGPYVEGGVDVTLRTADGTTPTVAEGGSYDASTGHLTLTDPTTASVAVSPAWTVTFASTPIDPTDGPIVTGAPQVGELLQVGDLGPDFAGTTCPSYSYRWLRDGEEFAGNAHFHGTSEVPQSENQDDWTFLGGTGTSPSGSYLVSATDLGHQLQVRVTCASSGKESTSAPTAVVTAAEPETPVAQGLQGPSSYAGGSFSAGTISGVIGDPTNPTLPIHVAQLDSGNRLVDPAQLSVAVSSVSGDELDVADVQVTGTGATRTVTITPDEPVHSATVVLVVTGTTGRTTELRFTYKASVATTPTSRVLLGSSDASTTIAVGDGHLLVADDERDRIRLYDPSVSGREEAVFWPYGAGQSPGDEIDFESAARRGDSIFWLGSHGNQKDGDVQASRHSLFETTLSGSGAGAVITPVGVRYGRLRADLVAWDHANGDRFGFAAGTASGTSPDVRNGFNIEGAEFSPDDSALYLGFRSPVVPSVADGRALIVPLLNVGDLTSGVATAAQFGEPVLLDLDGESIREIRKNARDEYLILSGQSGSYTAPPTQTLWAWNGDPGSAPRRLTTELPKDVEPQHTDNAGAWEGIGEMPARLAPGAPVLLVMDQGYDELYGSGENKKDGNDWTNKARTDVVELAGAAGTRAAIAAPGTFPDQAAGTLGAAREIVVTNSGSNLLHVTGVRTADDDAASADDFLISGDTCSGSTLDLDETCTVRVRFAPSRPDTTSVARLVVESDVPGGSTSVPLTGRTAPTVYALGYDLAGGTVTGNPASYTVESGAITLAAPTRTGYAFAGWTGTGLAQPTVALTIPTGSTGDRSYTATWTVVSYPITYELAGGTVAGAPAAYTIESAALTLPEPTRARHVFAGWTGTGLTGPTRQVTIPAGSTGARDYTATWTAVTSAISADPVSVAYGRPGTVEVTVTAPGAAPTGTVTLLDGDHELDVADLASGTASLVLPARSLAVGEHELALVYSGDGSVLDGAGSVLVTVTRAVAVVSATSASARYGAAGTLTASVTADGVVVDAGEVSAWSGSTMLARATVADGVARLGVPARSLAPGRRPLTLRYAGTDVVGAGSGSAVLTVEKARSRTTARLVGKRVRTEARPRLRVQVAAPGVVAAGKVRVTGLGRAVTGTLKAGRVTLTLPASARAGTKRLTVTYLGSGLVGRSTTTVRLAVVAGRPG